MSYTREEPKPLPEEWQLAFEFRQLCATLACVALAIMKPRWYWILLAAGSAAVTAYMLIKRWRQS